MNGQENFNVFIPVDISFVKGGDGKDKEMVIAGTASTTALDSDGDILLPQGFDIDYFIKKGFVNWNHRTNSDPMSIIGRPTKNTKIVGDKFHVEAQLFKGHPLAEQAYNLQTLLKAQGLSLGWSIEGKVEARDSDDARKVTKAKITGCALTPNPKNHESVVDIVKAEGMMPELSEAPQMNTKKGKALKKESLNKKVKDTTTGILKAEIQDLLKSRYPESNDSHGRVITIIETLEKSINPMNTDTQVISEEALNKAEEMLKLNLSPDTEVPNEEEIAKALTVLDKAGINIDLLKGKDEEEEEEEEDEEEEEEQPEPKPKAEPKPEPMEKGMEAGELIKGFADMKESIASLMKGFNEQIETQKQQIEELKKGLGENPGLRSIHRRSDLRVIEKGEGSEQLANVKTLSVSAQREEVIKAIEPSWYDGKEVINKGIADAICHFEASGVASPELQKAFTAIGIKLVA